MAQDISFRVTGMHCPACEFLVADEVALDPIVASARAGRKQSRLWVTLEEGVDPAELKARWNSRLDPLGYRLWLESEDPHRESRRETLLGMAFGAAFLAVFALLQASELVNLWAPDSLSLSGAFLLGLLASVSSCFALVGGLLVSFTSAVGRTNPGAVGAGLLAFHLARIGVFFVGGGLLGLAGAALGTSYDLQRLLLTLAALVMAGLGLSLLGVPLPGWKGNKAVVGAQKLARGRQGGVVVGGILLGAGTFLLPCGFTQSVQFQALASGSLAEGAALTLVFALGTLPVLGSLGWFLGKGMAGKGRAVLLKFGGTVVLGLGFYQLWGVLHLWGINV